jgi:ABC-2 type transport system permease protein
MSQAVELPSVEAEARAFWHMRSRMVRTLLRQTLQQSWFRVGLVLALSALLWMALFWLCLDGFRFLRSTILARDTYDQAVRAVLGIFFAALTVMLVFSSAIILYSSLFRSREAAFLLSLPARTGRVFLHKFQEAIVLSSWGFVLLGSPMLVAYGIVSRAPWYYFAMLLPLMIAFLYIPASLGAVVCLLLVHWLPSRRHVMMALLGATAIAAGAGCVWSLSATRQSDILNASWLYEMLARLRFTEHRLMPGWWLSSGLLEAARGQWSEAVMFLVLLVSNALMFRELAVWAAARIYRPAFSALASSQPGRKRARAGWFDRALLRAAWPLSQEIRLLLVKDIRSFRRDPVQWSQFLIFFGLLGLYFTNIRRLSYDIHYAGWVNMVSFLNLSVVGLLLSTFNTRFVFPLISLEAVRFWILGLLPVRRETILWEKFLFAAAGSLVPSCLLILLSDVMLGVSHTVMASHQLTCMQLAIGLAGITVGLGARFPNLREPSPARIAAGFGGTLNLVVSSLYIAVIVLLTAVPCHFYFAMNGLPAGGLGRLLGEHFGLWLAAGNGVSLAVTALATAVPMRMGIRAFKRLEF